MRLLDESFVQADEIDRLGHMNVRFYISRVHRAHEALMSLIGLSAERRAARGAVLNRVDTHCRFHREQRLGAALVVHGGVLTADAAKARLYFELRNPATGEVAATFITTATLETVEDREALALPAASLGLAERLRTPLPEYGAPRSLRLDAPRTALTFEEIQARVGEGYVGGGPMSQVTERVIDPEDCDEHGFLRDGENLMFGHRQRIMMETGEGFPQPIWTTDEGFRFGWAVMELRAMQFARPRRGDRLRSIGGIIDLQRKCRQSRRWIFDADTGRMVGVDDSVGIALDIDNRRSIEIPAKMREELETRHVPEFA